MGSWASGLFLIAESSVSSECNTFRYLLRLVRIIKFIWIYEHINNLFSCSDCYRGIVEQSHAHPREIMNEVLKALQELNVCWKKIGHYNMKCRWVPGFADGENTMVNDQLHFRDESSIIEDDCAMTSPTVIKFELQVTAKCKLTHISIKKRFVERLRSDVVISQ